MSIEDQIKQIEAMRDKAISAYERAIALAEKHRKEADDFNTALDVLSKIAPSSPPGGRHSNLPKSFIGGGPPSASAHTSGPIYQRILSLLKESDQLWWTANQIQDGLEAKGDFVKMTSISPNLSRIKDSGDIVRDDLKIALADRLNKSVETPEGDLLGRNPSEESKDHDLTNRGTQTSSPVKPWAGGGT